MTPEQQLAFVVEGSPACVLGAFEVVGSIHRDEAKITEAFRSGGASPGMSMTSRCFAAPSGFFGPPMRPIW